MQLKKNFIVKWNNWIYFLRFDHPAYPGIFFMLQYLTPHKLCFKKKLWDNKRMESERNLNIFFKWLPKDKTFWRIELTQWNKDKDNWWKVKFTEIVAENKRIFKTNLPLLAPHPDTTHHSPDMISSFPSGKQINCTCELTWEDPFNFTSAISLL